MLLAANLALSGHVAWTPGGFGIAFGRMLQDGIVKRYLDDHCPTARLKLCPYRNELPATADDFLWSNGVFNELGRFSGLGEEMRFIVLRSLQILANAFVCGALSGPHDRYGARIAWIATFTAAIAILRAINNLLPNAKGKGAWFKLAPSPRLVEIEPRAVRVPRE